MPHFPSKVKNVILCFMPGGVSHMDTFDPKPKLNELHGQLSGDGQRTWQGCPWSFKRYGQSGMPVSELLPHIATCVDDLAVVRSMVSGFPLHPRGNILFHTGRNVGGHPSLGSWITYALGSENENLPGYVLLHTGDIPPGPGEFLQRLPAGHPPGPARQGRSTAIDNLVASDDPRLQQAKLDLLLDQDRAFGASAGSDDAVEAAIRNYEMAYRMQSLVPDVLDLDKETEATKRLYGLDTTNKDKRNYSLQCLRARRLIEEGVRFVEVTCPVLFGQNNGTWDQHSYLKRGHEANALVTDQAVAALIKDLKSRGLLEETLLIWGTEFGRTPDSSNGDGRDHWKPPSPSSWRAGASRVAPLRRDRRDRQESGGERHHRARPPCHHPAPGGPRPRKVDLPLRRAGPQPDRRPRQRDPAHPGLTRIRSETASLPIPARALRRRRFLVAAYAAVGDEGVSSCL